MGSEKIFMFGEPSCGCGGGSKADLTAILPALMNNNKGIDPGILAMLGDRNRDGYDGIAFSRYLADLKRTGKYIDWEEMI